MASASLPAVPSSEYLQERYGRFRKGVASLGPFHFLFDSVARLWAYPHYMAETLDPVISPCHCAMLRKATRKVTQAYDEALAPVGLKVTQYSMMSAIGRAGTSGLGELAEILVMDRSTLGHNLRPLARDGLVEIRVADGDARGRQVSLTVAGRRKLEEARVLWRGVQRNFEEAFGRESMAGLRSSLLSIIHLTLPTP